MDELKQSVQLIVHEQKDPLVIYKEEAYKLFGSMIQNNIIKTLFYFCLMELCQRSYKLENSEELEDNNILPLK